MFKDKTQKQWEDIIDSINLINKKIYDIKLTSTIRIKNNTIRFLYVLITSTLLIFSTISFINNDILYLFWIHGTITIAWIVNAFLMLIYEMDVYIFSFDPDKIFKKIFLISILPFLLNLFYLTLLK